MTAKVIKLFYECVRCGVSKPFSEFYSDKRPGRGIRPTCKVCCREHNSRKYRDSQTVRDLSYFRHVKCKYEILKEQWQAMVLDQCGCCAVCHAQFSEDIYPCVEHDHDFDEVRGLTCDPCNRAIALMKDKFLTAYNIFEYLLRSKIGIRPLRPSVPGAEIMFRLCRADVFDQAVQR